MSMNRERLSPFRFSAEGHRGVRTERLAARTAGARSGPSVGSSIRVRNPTAGVASVTRVAHRTPGDHRAGGGIVLDGQDRTCGRNHHHGPGHAAARVRGIGVSGLAEAPEEVERVPRLRAARSVGSTTGDPTGDRHDPAVSLRSRLPPDVHRQCRDPGPDPPSPLAPRRRTRPCPGPSAGRPPRCDEGAEGVPAGDAGFSGTGPPPPGQTDRRSRDVRGTGRSGTSFPRSELDHASGRGERRERQREGPSGPRGRPVPAT